MPSSGTNDQQAEAFLDGLIEDPRSGINEVDRVVDYLAHDRGDVRRRAADALLSIATEQPAAVEDRYPDAVDTLLDSDEQLWVARKVVENGASLRASDVPPSQIVAGIRTGLDHALDELDEIATEGPAGSGSVPGNGATAVALADRLREYAVSVEGREQLVVEGLADAVEGVVMCHVRRANLDPIDTLVDLRSEQVDGDQPLTKGVAHSGKLTDMVEADGTRKKARYETMLVEAVFAGALVIAVEQSVPGMRRVEAVLAERTP